MNDEPVISYARGPRVPWVQRVLLVSTPMIVCCILSVVLSGVCMRWAQRAEGKVILDTSKNVALYRELIENIPTIVNSSGAIFSAISLLVMAALKKIPPIFSLLVLVYPFCWFGAVFLIALNSFAAFT